jgi:hypothetical protein
MPKLTPAQVVKQQYQSKADLAKQLIPLLEKPENLEQAEFERRIQVASNKQLLRLMRVTQTIKKRYGTKEALVEKLEKSKFPKGNADYKTKLMKLHASRLLDMARSIK